MPEPTTQAKLEEQFTTAAIPVGLPWRLLVFTIIIFAFSIVIYFGLRFGYENYLTQQGDNLDKQIDQLTSQVNQTDQQNFINFYSQLINLRTVLGNHGFSSNVFGFLEKNTIGSIYYTEADFSREGNDLNLAGEAASVDALVQQMNIFDKSPALASVNLNQLNFESRGTVGFSVHLVFNEDFTSKPAQ
ncbi:MAG: hypothetical protein UY23_C0001G0280 [Candidatus Jorgensenbacteria bacterium GW2011_GWA1_48_11]|uniref:Fimbrial assembly family protein n=1 Tax=Candidatus Jorgensenbacteria bacterium GW2011_GWA1_48_11 TaxID=1618660 RepID=A0A0G1UC40_9BACT|nr:MAG: hypothetical protein UY23_C0001G0280 [Candidatus Jorgensenbacteria bacterium GW2011_GWA1_48_11]KKW12165.1 MAG: hypothetical protein UY51_C0005G0407 [Candidatus Jorgensenbacteria bacterium GW2011_GWB1_49_9]